VATDELDHLLQIPRVFPPLKQWRRDEDRMCGMKVLIKEAHEPSFRHDGFGRTILNRKFLCMICARKMGNSTFVSRLIARYV
jgi:hypothetical protein